MTLMSNSSFSDYPENKTAEFTVNLPTHIALEGDWEVALTELMYPQTIQNVSAGNNSIIVKFEFNIMQYKYTFKRRVMINLGYYNSINELVDAINEKYTEDVGGDLLEFNDLTEKVFVKEQRPIPLDKYPKLLVGDTYQTDELGNVSIHPTKSWHFVAEHLRYETNHGRGWSMAAIAPEDRTKIKYAVVHTSIILEGFLALQLGFEPNVDIITTPASTQPKLDFGIPAELLVYCDVIYPQLFSDTHAQILRVTHTLNKGNHYGDSCVRSFQHRNYVPIIHKNFKTVTIGLRAATGSLIPFSFGTACVLLHFREV